MNTNIGWTVQSQHGWSHYEGEPGNTFTEDQLPHPEVQRAGGVDPDLYRRQHGLWVGEAAGPMPSFVGTETGYAPAEGLLKTGNVESYASFLPDAESALTAVSEESVEPVEDVLINE